MTVWIGVARVLAALKDQWSGTLVFIAQPAEEIGAGARMMLADGLYKRFPRPNYCLALHADALLEAGHIHYTEGLAMANVDTVEIMVKGKGGHGAAPHLSIDPDRDRRQARHRSANDRQPRTQAYRSRGGDSRLHTRRHQGQHHSQRGETPDHRSLDEGFVAQVDFGCDRAQGQGGGRQRERSRAGGDGHEQRVHAEAREQSGIDPKDDCPVRDKSWAKTRFTPGRSIMGGEDFSRYGLNGEIPIFMYFLGSVSAERVAASRSRRRQAAARGYTQTLIIPYPI